MKISNSHGAAGGRNRPPAAQPIDRSDADAIVVLTADRRDDLVARGGSGDWVLNPNKASRCRYLVCCRKERWDNRADAVPGRAAFLVGTIASLVRAPGPANVRNQHRYFIRLADVALVSQPDAWDPSWRNPVTYARLDALGIDPAALAFEPVASAGPGRGSPPVVAGRLTIAEAKRALAETFSVRPEDIEINIRG